jgi:hypothetical protein
MPRPISKSEFVALTERVLKHAEEFFEQLFPYGHISQNGQDWVVPQIGIRISLQRGGWFPYKGAVKDEDGNIVRTPNG